MSIVDTSSAPTTGRERAKQARVQRALDAARSILRREGVEGLQIRSIADEAGLAVRTLYNQFSGGKLDVLMALMSQELDDLAQALEQLHLDDGIEISRAVITVSIDRFRKSEDVMRPLMSLTYGTTDEQTAYLGNKARQLQERAVAKAIEDGQLRAIMPPRVLGHFILDAYANAGHRWARGALDHEGFEAQALNAWACLLLGLAEGDTRTRLEAEIAALAPRVEQQVERRRNI
ncbi:TetR/AcrR family transcriptional regulator [Pyruvatibacter mobilis]|uniref:TetR/AcrR family transcriptional regulator n=1 Tax=Pyruvatibacter mobilis TaxID=1712261 RepID=UPI003BB1922B